MYSNAAVASDAILEVCCHNSDSLREGNECFQSGHWWKYTLFLYCCVVIYWFSYTCIVHTYLSDYTNMGINYGVIRRLKVTHAEGDGESFELEYLYVGNQSKVRRSTNWKIVTDISSSTYSEVEVVMVGHTGRRTDGLSELKVLEWLSISEAQFWQTSHIKRIAGN